MARVPLFLFAALEMSRSVWTQFDGAFMSAGFVLMAMSSSSSLAHCSS